MLEYEDTLWGRVDFLHTRYHNIYTSLSRYLEMISKFQSAFLTFSKSLSSMSSYNYTIYYDKKLSIYPLIDSIPNNISLHSQEFLEISEFIKEKVLEKAKISLKETYIKENNLYQNYIKSKRIYTNSIVNLEKSKNNFNNNAKICENLIINTNELKLNNSENKKEIEKNENKVNEGIIDVINYENRYIEYLNEANKNAENVNKKELDLMKIYEKIDKDIVNKIEGIAYMYIKGFTKMYSTLLEDLTLINNQFKKINLENDINLLINKYNNNYLNKEDKIPFISYKLKSSLNYTLGESIGGNNLKDDCSTINVEEERKKNKLIYLLSKIFSSNADFLDGEKKELMEYLKEVSFRKYFFVMFSKQRTNNRYKRSEKLINDLSDILKIILDYSEKEKDYDGAKNCLILSQTFYCEIRKSDKKLYKSYLFNRINNNKWLKSVEFWENLIETMIEIEISNNFTNNKKDNLNEKSKKNVLNNIGFSQLLVYTKNMQEFGISKDIILSISQKFIDRYKLKKDYAEIIINNIKNGTNLSFEEEIIDEEQKNKKNQNIEPNKENEKQEFDKSKIHLLNNDNYNNLDKVKNNNSKIKVNAIKKNEESKENIDNK